MKSSFYWESSVNVYFLILTFRILKILPLLEREKERERERVNYSWSLKSFSGAVKRGSRLTIVTCISVLLIYCVFMLKAELSC